ncbi:GMC family oxidoreductase [Neobacillus massiliamazoniensis]|uniref:Oxidoreductase n=1 Tax=Neobacillus massiliamazoniensis TaxID=1499688 RepID=A0A0U1P2Y4_9BACI|nr:GMC family oxidoreductase [Neobacillus massiliamazoniensis]CRK84674.1 oxidoreductase [Neobacillus massiliamazoniensis]
MDKNNFDYIVIGAGTAGGIIAKKLSDDHRTSVLVLETGTNMTKELSSPNVVVALTNATNNRQSFNVTTILEQQLGRQLITESGRAIGGSSEHNAMLAVRGSRDFYDEWARQVGNQWSYDNIRSLFKKNETYTGGSQEPQERGFNGPIFVRQQIIPNQGLIQTLTQATSDVFDIPIVEDYNTGIRDCTFFKSQFTQKAESESFIRSSTATGYLNSHIVTQGNEFNSDEFGVNGRKLVIFAKTTVNKILFKRHKGFQIAVGVEFIKNGVSEVMNARKGIVISAGQFSSVILQRSGIGRPDDLAKAGIATLVDSPNVGHNFQTQFYVGMGVRVETGRILQVLGTDPNQPSTLGAFKKQDNPKGGRRLQLLGFPVPVFVPVQDVLINGWQFDDTKPSNVMSIAISNLNPTSRGTILIGHSDPEAYPTIDLNPLADNDDLNYMVDKYIETYNMVVRARQLDPGGIYEVVYPNESIFQLADEEKRTILAAYVRASYTNFAHFGCQCKMGQVIEEGVVDGFLNVFGTKNLKIADLSIAPILPDGNTSTGAQMIGLNAVRFIRNDEKFDEESSDESSDESSSSDESRDDQH